jgi:hypothetical protein
VDFTLQLTFENPDFYIRETVAEGGSPSKLRIDSASLHIKHVLPSPEVRLSHEKGLQIGRKCIYEYKRGDIYVQSISKGTTSLAISNLYNGPAPSLAIFGMLKASDYNAVRKSSPFTFAHNNLKNFSFVYNSENIPSNGYDIKIASNLSCYAQVFSKVYESLGHHASPGSTLITRENFPNSHFLIIQDFSSFNNALADVSEPLKNVLLGVSGAFTTPTTETLIGMLYVLVPSRIEIDKHRNVEVVL